MKEQFVTYETALKLAEIGYDNPFTLFDGEGQCYKIIAGGCSISIDFNGFEEQLGIVDVKRLALNEYPIIDSSLETIQKLRREVFIKGCKTVQELNKNKFSLEDMQKAYYQGHKSGLTCYTVSKSRLTFKQLMSDLSQPKIFDVEIETEKGFNGEPRGEMEFFERPKIVNNQIKIIKIL